jgi:O-methyltransferase
MNIAKILYHALPRSGKKLAVDVWTSFPWTKAAKHAKWVKEVYVEFGHRQRREIFLSAARFLHINRPVEGYYFEFGCNSANTVRMAWDSFQYLFDFTYVGFDSFEGLPTIEKVDEQDIWEKGKLAFAEERFVNTCIAHGIPRERLMTVRGFYDQSLTQELATRLLPKKAAVIYVDCDLYISTVSVLNWIPPFLQVGTIVVFDDWNCFSADPERGERRAWREFLEAHSQFRFEPFVSTAEGQTFICVAVGTASI